MDNVCYMDHCPLELGYINCYQLHSKGDYAIIIIPHTSWGDYLGSINDRSNHECLMKEWKDWDGVYDVQDDYNSHMVAVYMNGLTHKQRDIVTDTIRALSDYPVYNDEHVSALELQVEEEDWDSWILGDVRRGLDLEMSDASIKESAFENDIYWYAETAVGGYLDVDKLRAALIREQGND